MLDFVFDWDGHHNWGVRAAVRKKHQLSTEATNVIINAVFIAMLWNALRVPIAAAISSDESISKTRSE
jgi:hypothetical protein